MVLVAVAGGACYVAQQRHSVVPAAPTPAPVPTAAPAPAAPPEPAPTAAPEPAVVTKEVPATAVVTSAVEKGLASRGVTGVRISRDEKGMGAA